MMPVPHIPTVFLMVVVSCLSLATAIGLAGRRGGGDGEGLGVWAVSLCLHAFGYLLLYARDRIPDFLSIVVANVTLAGSIALLTLAIGRFAGARVPKWIGVGSVVAAAVVLTLFIDDMRDRVIAINSVFLAQLVFAVRLAGGRTLADAARGRAILCFSLWISIVVTGGRVAMGAFAPERAATLFQSSAPQIATFILSYFSIILTTGGFVMMAKERSDERLRAMALRDPLTDCWNRVGIEEIARREMERASREGRSVSLLMLDLDHFKDVNDRFGHAAGDGILKTFSETAREIIRPGDMFGRWGGEEFVAILPSTDGAEAMRIAEAIRVATGVRSHADGVHVTVSVGLAVLRTSDGWREWLGRADAALYAAKEGGRDQVRGEDAVPSGAGRDLPFLRLVWRPEFECGDPRVDAPHRRLFERVNDVILSADDRRDAAEIAGSLPPLLEALREHFVDEVALLREIGYVGADAHEREHEALIDDARDMIRRHADGTVGTRELIRFFVFDLISRHMMIEDRRFFPFLAESGRARAAARAAKR